MPSPLTVRVDRQGRLVLPQHLREGLVDLPGELLVEVTDDGLLLSPVNRDGAIKVADDGLPVLHLTREVTRDQVQDAIDQERCAR